MLPTDTVYGLGADAFDTAAVADLLLAKGRGRDMPVPVLVGSWATIEGLTSSVAERTWDLIEAFWPGGLTLVVEHAPSLTWDLGDARGTVGDAHAAAPGRHRAARDHRPDGGVQREHLRPAAGGDRAEAREQLGEAVAVYLDGGPAAAQVASTIVDVTAEVPRVVRAGAVELDELRAVVPDVVG